jgi:hypothetical protein
MYFFYVSGTPYINMFVLRTVVVLDRGKRKLKY